MNIQISQKIKFLYILCMVLLVFIHGYNLDNKILGPNSLHEGDLTPTRFIEIFLANGLFRFRIPLLLLISGYLLARSKPLPYWELIQKKTKTLLLPMFLIACCSLILSFFIETVFLQGSHNGVWGSRISDYSVKEYFVRIIVSPLPFQLWYLKSLFLLTALYPVIKLGLQRFPNTILILLFILWAVTDNIGGLRMIRYSFYFAFGIYIFMKNLNIEKYPFNIPPVYGFLGFVFAALLKTLISFNGDIIFGSYTVYVVRFLYDLTAILGILFVWFRSDAIVKYCSDKKWYQNFSNYFFFIYAFHAPMINYMTDPFLNMISFVPAAHLIAFLVLPVIVIGICAMLDNFIGFLFPSFYVLFTGGRGNSNNLPNIQRVYRAINHYFRANDIFPNRFTIFSKNDNYNITSKQ